MLTIMAMRWNQQKFDNLASTLARQYRKVKTPVFPYAKCIAILSNKILNVHTIYIDSPRIYEYTVYLISVVCGFLIVKVLHNCQSCRRFPHCHLCLKAKIALQCQLHNLEAMKTVMDIADSQLERWIFDVNVWAEGRIYCFILFDIVLAIPKRLIVIVVKEHIL